MTTSTNAEAAREHRPSPDQEALELLVRLADRVEVARSFARICAGLLQEQAARASVALRARELARVADLGRFARAAADAAASVAASEVRRVVGASAKPEPREPVEGEPTRDPAKPRTKNAPSPAPAKDDDAPSSLDHEALHDDAC